MFKNIYIEDKRVKWLTDAGMASILTLNWYPFNAVILFDGSNFATDIILAVKNIIGAEKNTHRTIELAI